MPRRAEMPGMEALWQKYREQGFVVVAISNDEGSKARVETFLKLLDLSFPILLDQEGEVNDLYKVSSMPTSFLMMLTEGLSAVLLVPRNGLHQRLCSL